ncbi:DUF4194 domain-containing protein [Schaalia sp. Marseille-Q2122]|uniref:DUF4194 domain-containing protein n=1 Tax=Schaalia sp. Marseille-Q2122 TaxID=2736604 RepID=UPI0015899253|nr:DUF4194 domain-containing protein [Schaalia sp. Marseille-Q2122]
MDFHDRHETPVHVGPRFDGLPAWPGDTGELGLEVRKLLVRLMKDAYITATEKRYLWALLLEHEEIVRSRLNDILLELVIDRELGIAFARNAHVSETVDIPKVMSAKALTHAATMLLVYLRQQHMRAQASGDIAFITDEEIFDYLRSYVENVDKQNEVEARKRSKRASENLVQHSVLKVTGEEGRYQIGDIVTLIVDVDTATELIRQYEALIERYRQPSSDRDDTRDGSRHT